MKRFLQVCSACVFIAGGIWFLQGINVLPGSYMTGNPQWAINGGIAMLLSAAVFFWAGRKNIS